MNNDTLIFVGRSGSGKGTQVALLKELLEKKYPDSEIFHLESGDRIRDFVKHNDTYTGDRVRDVLQEGLLVPDFITESLLVHDFIQNLNPEKMFILDGFPRTLNQAHTLNSVMKFYKRDNVKIIHVEVSEDEVRGRLSGRGRADDRDINNINKRISWYNENVLPVLDYFRSQDDYEVIDIDGEVSIDDVHQSIIEKLGL